VRRDGGGRLGGEREHDVNQGRRNWRSEAAASAGLRAKIWAARRQVRAGRGGETERSMRGFYRRRGEPH
jgi:hypothetical protein